MLSLLEVPLTVSFERLADQASRISLKRVTAELVDCWARLEKVSLWLRLCPAIVESRLLKSWPSVGLKG